MRFNLNLLLALGATTSVVAAPGVTDLDLWARSSIGERASNHISSRPHVKCHPKTPSKPPPYHPKRDRICYVKSNGNGTDDSAHVLSAVKSCNNGGHVVFRQGALYTIGKALDLTFLKHIDIDIQGYIQFTNDTDYWQANSFKTIYQNSSTFWNFGGKDVDIYGGGTIDGNGQVWYDLYAKNIYILRPVLLGVIGLKDSTISDINLRYSPQWYTFVANSSNVIFDNINIAGASKSPSPAKNTDGWDIYRSDNIVIQNSIVNNGDDCISFKPNSTNILVQNMYCNGSHGISVGSLGQYPGEYDIVENLYIYNTSMFNASDGARIKVWPNSASALSGDLQGGGGTGRVKNVTYDTFYVENVDYAIEITQCYGQKNLTLCQQYPSRLTITDIVFKNFTGKTSTRFAPQTSSFACSSSTVCNNINALDINAVSTNGSRFAYCLNVDQTKLDVDCQNTYKGSG